MIDKEEILRSIQSMTYRNKYNHVMSALDVVLQEDGADTEAKRDATIIIRLHIKVNNETMMETAGVSY